MSNKKTTKTAPKASTVSKKEKVFIATGRRKCAVARVSLVKGSGQLVFRSKGRISDNQLKKIMEPLALVGKEKDYDVVADTAGGGVSARIDAIRLGVARALVELDADSKTILRKNGFITRDSREKERKKPGLRRARRAPQWAKR